MGTDVKFFHSEMASLPPLNGVPGSGITLLDAVLKDGAGVKTVDTLVVLDGVATMNVSGGHTFIKDQVVFLAGITGALAALNGEQRLATTATGALTFATAAANGTAAGTITVKYAPLGWTKPFTASNMAAYKPADVTATGCLLRVDDTGNTNMRVYGHESMTDINTGLGRFPTNAQQAGGMFWGKSASADATARSWLIVGDSKGFYFWSATARADCYAGHWFGDILAYKSGDAYGCALAGMSGDFTNTASVPAECMGVSAVNVQTHYYPRLHTAVGSSAAAAKFGTMHCPDIAQNNPLHYSGQAGYSPTLRPLVYPNPQDNGMLLSRVLSWHTSGIRGAFPGVFHTPQQAAAFSSARDVVDGTGDFYGRKMMAVTPANGNRTSFGVAFMDLTGPWR